jgi:aminopeptidase N
VVGEPLGAQAWFPANNHPSDKATYTTRIAVPAGQVGVGVGEQAAGSPSTAAGRTTWTWVEDDPTASYLVTASNGNHTVTEGTFTEAQTSRSLPYFDAVTVTAAPPQVDAIEALSALNAEMVDALGAHYGPYPLDSYGSVWDNVPSAGYALEVQTKSHFSSLPAGPTPSAGLTSTYLHELAHQWWGNAVTLEHWNDLWFNEGWAVLSEWLYDFEQNGGDSPGQRFDDEYAAASAGDWSVAPAVLNNDPALMFSPSFPTYTRGAMTLAGYREIVGASPFDGFARALQTEYAYDNISTQEFIAEAKAASGLAGAQLALLDQYFQEWLYGTTKPTITPDDFP